MHHVVVRRVSQEPRGEEIFREVFPETQRVPALSEQILIQGTGDYQGHRAEIIGLLEKAAPDEWWRHWSVPQAQS